MTKENQQEQDLAESTKDKKSLMNWIKAHKKQLILIGISILALIATVLGLKNKDVMMV